MKRLRPAVLVLALLNREVAYRVVLSPGYGLVTSRAKRYPVLYLLHGWGGHYDSWLTHSSLRQYAAEHQLIVVTPEGGEGWYTDAPGGEPYESHLLRELVPDVDARFRTIPHRRGRGVAGYSMGGYGALKFGFKHPELFAFAATLAARGIAHDYRQRPGGHFWPYWDAQTREILRVASDILAAPE